MPIFQYQGRDREGNLKKETRNAQSADSLSTALMNEGITPISIKSVEKSNDFWGSFINGLFEQSVSVDEMGIFTRQMYTLTKAGVPLPRAMRDLAKGSRNVSLKKALNGMVNSLESGQDIASAMQYFPNVFSPLMINMVKVGQSSGRLAEAFLQINQYIELEAGTMKNIKTALRYPMMVTIAMLAAIVLINIFVIPAFARVFLQAKVPLPWETQLLITTSQFFINYGIILLVLGIVLVAGFFYYIHTEEGRYQWDKFLFHIPIFGKLLKRIFLLRFIQTFSIIIDSGIPLIEGIELSAQAVNNEFVKRKILSMRGAIERGNNLTQAAMLTDLFSSLELQILGVSEETGELGAMLDQIASFYKREVEFDLKKLSDTIEPTLIILLSGVILVLALAVYLPIWNMAKVAKLG
jgi:MSHA biogenesis protein MshG